jgi:hypothetical protein
MEPGSRGRSASVPVIGYDPVTSTLTFVDVLYGVQRTMTTQAFAAAMTTFGGMGVAVAKAS